jgi:FkbM family methyltransferase
VEQTQRFDSSSERLGSEKGMKGVISIGSHWGEEYKKWKCEGAENFIFFEPVSFNYKHMMELLPDENNIRAFNMAIGNKKGKITINVENDENNKGQSCSILEPKLHLEQFPHIVFDSTEEVGIDRLDNIKYGRALYDYLHIDVQGYELEVLKGATQSMQYINVIDIEVNRAELYLGCAMIVDIDTFLRVMGFYRISVDWYGGNFGGAIYKKISIMTKAEKKYVELCNTPSDTNEHLPTLQNYASQCHHVTELGVRKGVTTWAFLASKTHILLSVDINYPEEYGGSLPEIRRCAEEAGIEFRFVLADDLNVELEETDLLFIDTLHVYRHLKAELDLHAGKARKFIIIHDTETFGIVGADGGTGLFNAIHEFLVIHKGWRIKEIFKNNNGLTILERYEVVCDSSSVPEGDTTENTN